MSLSAHLRYTESPVRRFFSEVEDKKGLKKCLDHLQSSNPLHLIAYEPAETFVYAIIGTTVDYLIRYVGCGNTLDFKKTIAFEALKYIKARREKFKHSTNLIYFRHLKNLFAMGKRNLDGRAANNLETICSATALAIMDGQFRSGDLPWGWLIEVNKHNRQQITSCEGINLSEKTTNYCFEKFFSYLGGLDYVNDVKHIIEIFSDALENPESEIYNAKIVVPNQSLKNSNIVGGADFDCVIEYNNKHILTDIKTAIKPLSLMHLRQLISYALLYDTNKDNFSFTEIGFYHSRSGSFRSLPLSEVVSNVFPNFNCIEDIRKYFINKILNWDYTDNITLPVKKERQNKKTVKVGDNITFCFIDSPFDNHVVQIVNTESILKDGILNQKEQLAQALLGVSVGESSNLEIKGLEARKLKVIKIQPGRSKAKEGKPVYGTEISQTKTKCDEGQANVAESEYIGHLISLMKFKN